MISVKIQQQLSSFRTREAMIRLAWGLAAWIAIALIMLGIACGIDRWVDRYQETPSLLRWTLSIGQVVLNLGFFYMLVIRPLARVPSVDVLAGRVEDRVPEYRHRLVTALQLNRDEAERQRHGVSPELLAEVTREAEQITTGRRFASFADHRRLAYGLGVILPPVLVLGAALLVWPELTRALLARQALLDREIPRSIQIASVTPEVHPTGEEVELRFEITNTSGSIADDSVGEVRVWQEEQPLQRLTLTYAEALGPDQALFTTRVPASTRPFTYRAYLGDGRMTEAGAVRFEPRPVVTRLQGWLQLPEYVGTRPDGSRYEREMDQGEIFGRPDTVARVRIETQKPIVEATLVLLTREEGATFETELDRIPMEQLGPDAAHALFQLTPEQTAYRIEVRDEYGFANATSPRRNVAMAPDDPPFVSLLPERFPPSFGGGFTEESEVEGLPVLLGGPIRVGYSARSPLGLLNARLVYRINGGPERRLPLTLTETDGKLGEFDLRRGKFEKMSFRDQVEFYPVPSPEQKLFPDGLDAGGQFNFQTAGLTKLISEGFPVELEVGDEIEFAVEVFDRKKLVQPNRPPGRSETRVKVVVDGEDFTNWIQSLLATEDRIRRLRENQQQVFGDEGS